jgi:hypothetical protein
MKRSTGATAGCWGRCPQTPGIYRLAAKMAEGKISGRLQPQPPRATSATESALGLRPRRALSSAQLRAEWSHSTSPYNDFSSNGVYPLNSVSHSRGSLHFFLDILFYRMSVIGIVSTAMVERGLVRRPFLLQESVSSSSRAGWDLRFRRIRKRVFMDLTASWTSDLGVQFHLFFVLVGHHF